MAESSIVGIGIYADTRAANDNIDDLNDKLRETENQVEKVDRASKKTESTLGRLGTYLKTLITFEVIRRIALISDEFQSLEARIRGTVSATTDYNQTLTQLQGISSLVGIELKDTVDTFQNLSFAREELRATDEQIAAFTLAVTELGAISGAGPQQLASGLLQVGQALTAGRLQMQDFKAIMSSTPAIAVAIAEGLNVSVGELRKMITAGEVSSAEVFNAILGQSEDIKKKFEELPDTFGRASVALKDSVGRAITDLLDVTGISAFGPALIRSLAVAIDTFPEFGRALSATLIQALVVGGHAIEEFALISVPEYFETGFENVKTSVTKTWQELVKGLQEQLNRDPVFSFFLPEFDVQDNVDSIQEIETEHTKALDAIQAKYNEARTTLREGNIVSEAAARENAQRFRKEWEDALGEVESALAGLNSSQVSDVLNPALLLEAQREFIAEFGADTVKINAEYDKRLEDVATYYKEHIIDDKEFGDAIRKLAFDRNEELREADLALWEQRLGIAARGAKTVEDEIKRSFTTDFGSPNQQQEAEFKDRLDLLKAYLDQGLITEEEYGEALKQLVKDRNQEIIDTEESLWKQRLDVAKRSGRSVEEEIRRSFKADFGNQVEQEDAAFQDRLDTLRAYLDEGLITEEEYFAARKELEADHALAAAEAEEEIWRARFDRARAGKEEYEIILADIASLESENGEERVQAQKNIADRLVKLTSQAGGKLAKVGQAIALARATQDAYVAIQAAWASAPFPANLPAVAIVTAEVLANIAAIKQNQGNIEPRAYGGTVQEGGLFRVGELTSELFTGRSGQQIFIPPESGTITPISNKVAAPNLTVNVVNAPQGTEVRRSPDGLTVDVILSRVENHLSDNLIQGRGPVSRAFERTFGLSRQGEF